LLERDPKGRVRDELKGDEGDLRDQRHHNSETSLGIGNQPFSPISIIGAQEIAKHPARLVKAREVGGIDEVSPFEFGEVIVRETPGIAFDFNLFCRMAHITLHFVTEFFEHYD
jgi:hypothetical protein